MALPRILSSAGFGAGIPPPDTPEAAAGGFRRATILACIVCALLTAVGMLVPPSMYFDPACGMLEWRTLATGGPLNTIVAPDPAAISKDRAEFIAWWSPGQYLIPGAFTTLGFRLGPALSMTAGLSLLCCLLGWIRVVKYFAFGPRTAMLTVIFLSTFRYSTLPFGIYNGGEILLQGITPWLILAGCYVPVASAVRAAGIACLAILAGFFVKLTGILVAVAALIAGSIVALMRLRRFTTGMFAGATGAVLALALLYATWFSRGATPATGAAWSLQPAKFVFAFAAPWGAGISWMDMLAWVLLNPARPILRQESDLVVLLLPPAVVFAAVVLWGMRRGTASSSGLKRLLSFALCFYAICALTVAFLMFHGGAIGVEERHLRSAGTLIFVGVLAVAGSLPAKSATRLAVFVCCAFTSLYGIGSFAGRIWSARPGDVDPYSRTRPGEIDVEAVAYARSAFVREGREALFVVLSPDVANAFPPGARILLTDPESREPLPAYAGTVPGHVYVLIPTRLARTTRGMSLLRSFQDLSPDAWEGHRFGATSVLVHAPPIL